MFFSKNFKYFFFCFVINNNDTIAVNASVHGAANHTPVIPRKAGKINVNARSKTTPLSAEIRAEDFASPQLVKYMELITSYPIITNVVTYTLNPEATISTT